MLGARFFGPINPPSNQKTYILVATEYVTKWVEVEALSRATEDSVIQFLIPNICAIQPPKGRNYRWRTAICR